MKLGDLKRKLDLITDNCNDFEVYIDAGDFNLIELEKVYVGGSWNIVLSIDDEDEDIEDDSSIAVHKK